MAEKSTREIWATHAGGSGKFSDGQSHIDWACRRVDKLEAWIKALEPHLDSVVCYASTIREHPVNRVVKEIRDDQASG